MSKRIQSREGDVFTIELKKGLYAFGQIVAKGRTADTFVGFDWVSNGMPKDLDAIVSQPISLFLHAIDAEIANGHWKIIGNAPVPASIRFPEYVTATLSQHRVISHKGEVLRYATEEETRRLSHMRSSTPTSLEKALRARHGLEEWKAWMDDMLYSKVKGWVPYRPTEDTGSDTVVSQATESKTEQAVVVHFNYGSTDLGPLKEVEKEIEQALERAGVGDYDGDEVATDGRDGYLYMYGPDADKVFKVVEPILKRTKFMKGARVKRRYGPPKDGVKSKITVV